MRTESSDQPEPHRNFMFFAQGFPVAPPGLELVM